MRGDDDAAKAARTTAEIPGFTPPTGGADDRWAVSRQTTSSIAELTALDAAGVGPVFDITPDPLPAPPSVTTGTASVHAIVQPVETVHQRLVAAHGPPSSDDDGQEGVVDWRRVEHEGHLIRKAVLSLQPGPPDVGRYDLVAAKAPPGTTAVVTVTVHHEWTGPPR
ncbi:MAG: hypothetical protein AAGD35_02275 [Actinomycetota bacterium]